MESHHVVGTHPQALNTTADLNSQYDNWSDYVGRQFTATGVQSPSATDKLSEQEIFDQAVNNRPEAGRDPATLIPDGMSARNLLAQQTRATLSEMYESDFADAGDAELIDALLYNVFPNMSFWAGMRQNIVYRFRPDGMDPEAALMDIVILRPVPKDGPRPEPAEIRVLDYDEPVTDAGDQIGDALALVFEQDVVNLPWVQKGLRALRSGEVAFTDYMEVRLRRHHQMLDEYIARGEAG